VKHFELISADPSLKFPQESPHFELHGISPAARIRSNTVVFAKNKKYIGKIAESILSDESINHVCLIIDEKDYVWLSQSALIHQLNSRQGAVATVKDVQIAMAKISKPFYDMENLNLNDLVDGRQMATTDVHPTAWIAQGVFLGQNVKIAEGVFIHPGVTILSNCVIEKGTTIYPNVTLYRGVKIGRDCRIHAGSVIGADGFGYQFHAGQHIKIWHLGSVKIGDNVEIGANTTIDRGTFSDTEVHDGCIIDNQVQIAHNCIVGKGVVLCGKVGLAGSVEIGDFTVAGGLAAFAPEVKVGKACQIAGMAGVTTSWPDKSIVAGHPARELREWLKSVATLRKLTLAPTKES